MRIWCIVFEIWTKVVSGGPKNCAYLKNTSITPLIISGTGGTLLLLESGPTGTGSFIMNLTFLCIPSKDSK